MPQQRTRESKFRVHRAIEAWRQGRYVPWIRLTLAYRGSPAFEPKDAAVAKFAHMEFCLQQQAGHPAKGVLTRDRSFGRMIRHGPIDLAAP